MPQHKERFDTIAIHGRDRRWRTSSSTFALTTPIFETASFGIDSLDEAAAIIERGGSTFQLGEDYVYSRGGNPTQRALEGRLAELEGGEDSVVFASGMAAIMATSATLLSLGDHAVVTGTCFGDSYHLFAVDFARMGVSVTFVDTAEVSQVGSAIRPTTKMVFIETPANPTLRIADLGGISDLCRPRGVVTVVDNTFASPYLQRPLTYGCDVVVHSLTKYLSGHGDAVGGAVVSSNTAFLRELRLKLFSTGAVLDPFAAFLTLRGIQTLGLRVRQHCASAEKVAKFLSRHPKILRVFYPGLPIHPQHDLAKRQMRAFGGVIAFELCGGLPEVRRFLASLELCTFAVSIGSTKTLVEAPAGMTHRIMPLEARLKAGISDGLVRISVGLEDVKDIIGDLRRALAKT